MVQYSALHYATKAEKSAASASNSAAQAKASADSIDTSIFVKTSGNQTIAGAKTFTSVIQVQGLNVPQKFKASNIDLTTPPSANMSMLVDYLDKNGTRIGVVGAGHYPSGRYRMYLQAANIGSMGIGVGTNGKVYTEAPTPPASDNSTQIATTAWVNSRECTTAATTTSSASKTKPAVIVQNYVNGNNWYRVWSDGWIEQGGLGATGNGVTITLLKAFKNTSYSVYCTLRGSLGSYPYAWTVSSVTTTNFVVTCDNTSANPNKQWYACGY